MKSKKSFLKFRFIEKIMLHIKDPLAERSQVIFIELISMLPLSLLYGSLPGSSSIIYQVERIQILF